MSLLQCDVNKLQNKLCGPKAAEEKHLILVMSPKALFWTKKEPQAVPINVMYGGR